MTSNGGITMRFVQCNTFLHIVQVAHYLHSSDVGKWAQAAWQPDRHSGTQSCHRRLVSPCAWTISWAPQQSDMQIACMLRDLPEDIAHTVIKQHPAILRLMHSNDRSIDARTQSLSVFLCAAMRHRCAAYAQPASPAVYKSTSAR